MAKKIVSTPEVTENDALDNLLNGTPGTPDATQVSEEMPAVAVDPELTTEQIAANEEIKALQAKIKELKAKNKGESVKPSRTLKGQMVTFLNKKGERITGLGVTYFVARSGGKLHYKEATQVTLLPESWKEGDAIPEVEEVAAAE